MHIPCHSGPQVDEKTKNRVFLTKMRFLAVEAGLPSRSALERIAPPPRFKWSESPQRLVASDQGVERIAPPPPGVKWGERAQSAKLVCVGEGGRRTLEEPWAYPRPGDETFAAPEPVIQVTRTQP